MGNDIPNLPLISSILVVNSSGIPHEFNSRKFFGCFNPVGNFNSLQDLTKTPSIEPEVCSFHQSISNSWMLFSFTAHFADALCCCDGNWSASPNFRRFVHFSSPSFRWLPIMFASSSRNWNLVDVQIYFDKSGSNIGAEVLSVSLLKKGECGDM